MAWKKLTVDDLRLILSEDETTKLNDYSLADGMEDVVLSTIEMVSDVWRGALGAKGYEIDVRSHYVPETYAYYILVHARHAVWTRFPNSENIALDERRKNEYDEAMKLLKDPFLGVDGVSGEGVSPSAEAVGTGSGSIRVPLMRFPPWYVYGEAGAMDLKNYL